MPKIKDVAEAAGVSTATVSRVLADKPYVRPEIREKVLAAVKKLNYRPNLIAQSLRVQRTNIIGLIVSDIQNPFFTLVSRSVEDAAYRHGYSIFLCNADEDPKKEAMYLNHMRDQNVAGVLVSPTRQTAETFGETVRLPIPFVVIDRRVRGIDVDSVLTDNVDAAYKIVDHLLQDGYRRIGAIFGSGSTTGRERREGYLQALQAHNVSPIPEIQTFGMPREEEGYAVTMKLLDLPKRPDAIFTSNGLLAAGAFRAIRERKLRIPKDIGFASFDETPWTSLVEPTVSVIQQPTYEIGQTAIELLLKRLEDPDRPASEVILKSKLIIRQSCGCHT